MSIENLQTAPIFVRSPYNVVIDEPLQLEGKIEIFIWNEGSTPPTVPTYVAQKKIPTPTDLKLIFNISNFVRENIEFEKNQVTATTLWQNAPVNEWCFVKVKRYALINGNAGFDLLDTKTYIALEGWTKYEDEDLQENVGIEGATILLSEGTYQYLYNPNYVLIPFSQPYGYRYGDVTLVLPTSTYGIRYTDLVTGATVTQTYTGSQYVVKHPLVYPLYEANGNLVEWVDSLDRVFWSATMKPVCEPKYDPITVDFVNKYGAWQRTFFFKASRKSLSVTREQYDFLAREIAPYNRNLPERRQFNVNGIQRIKMNTGWIENDSYNDIVLVQMMLTEEIRIALNNFAVLNQFDTNPIKMITSNTELFENINQHLINYELEFEYAYDYINNIV